jgi:Zn-dependent protease/predicted transcriptional regulator
MSWSWSIGRISGIRIKIHFTFLLFVGWIAVSQGILAGDTARALLSVTLMLLVFGCVLLHELGHALTARRFGVATHDIILLPIGGVARLERMPEKPSQEILVALAGPAVNVAIALVLGAIMVAFRMSLDRLSITGGLVESLLYINAVIVIFNLIPAFPMDGGRVLRALLAMRLPFVRATRIASYIGQGMAVLFGIAGLALNHPMLMLVAVFVFLAANEERAMVQSRTAMRGIPARAAMLTEFQVLEAGDTLEQAAARLVAGSQTDFPVVHEGVAVGLLCRDELVAGLREAGPAARVGEVMQPDQSYVDPGEPLEAVVRRMQASRRSALPVITQGRVVGLVTIENVSELLTAQDAVRRFQGAS